MDNIEQIIKENTKINVKDFVDKYNNTESEMVKDGMVKTIIYRTYAPILEKKVVLEGMFSQALTTDEYGVMYVDEFLNKSNVDISIVLLYTSLDFKRTN